MKFVRLAAIATSLTASAAIAAAAGSNALTTGMQNGAAALQSAGPLAFGPEGILFVGDPKGAQVFALDTADTKPGKPVNADLPGLQDRIAAHLGSSADQVMVNDLAVNPVSKAIYLSVSRGRGPEATPVILRLRGADAKLEEVKLDKIMHSSATLANAPGPNEKDRRGASKRNEAITDLAYHDGQVIVAGLSNEEFASALRAIPFPFKAAGTSTAVEIFHGAHGQYETNAPVRTFTIHQVAAKPHILAAYTCTPLVRIPVSDLKPGAKIMGTTIAELGNRNRPLDMIVYQKEGGDYILMNNSSRGVMKMKAGGLEAYSAITKPTDITGVPYETIAAWKGVEQLDRLDHGHAVMLVRTDGGGLDLKKVALP